MRKPFLMMSVLAVSLALPAAAMADAQGQGRGNGNGQDHAQDGQGRGNGNGGGRGQQRAERDTDRSHGDPGRGQGSLERDADHGNGSQGGGRGRAAGDDHPGQGAGPSNDSHGRGAGRDRDNDGPAVVARNRDEVVVLVRQNDRGLIDGCPPGLAWRNNGCLPPGQTRQAEHSWNEAWLWDRRDDGTRYTYANGYVYQTRQDGGLAGWLPVLAGALGLNNIWPQQYRYEPVPQYYSSYYGLGDRYDYRYADGVVYGLDPKNNRIQQVTALLTGQQWSVGERMPRGYDAYNVPYAYRSQYRDTPDSWYRYNDGYVYQVDPTTQLVQAVIQLLT